MATLKQLANAVKERARRRGNVPAPAKFIHEENEAKKKIDLLISDIDEMLGDTDLQDWEDEDHLKELSPLTWICRRLCEISDELQPGEGS